MSEGHRVSLLRGRRQSVCAEVLAQAVGEMLPACGQAVSFFLSGFRDFFLQPLPDTVHSYRETLTTRGAIEVGGYLNARPGYEALRAEAEIARLSLARAVDDAGLDQCAALIEADPVPTRGVLEYLREANDAVADRRLARDELSNRLSEIGVRLESERTRCREAYDKACLAVAAEVGQDNHGVFDSLTKLIEAASGQESAEAQRTILDTARIAESAAADQVDMTWRALVMQAARLAAERTGFNVIDFDALAREPSLVAVDATNSERRLSFRVHPGAAEVEYRFDGYAGGACKEPSSRFRSAFRDLSGVDLSENVVQTYDTEVSEAPVTRRKVRHGEATRKESKTQARRERDRA